MTTGEGVAFGSLVATIIGLVLKFTNDEATKRRRIYERVDEVKKAVDEKLDIKFVNKDICNLTHKQTNDTLQEIKADVKLLLRHNGLER